MSEMNFSQEANLDAKPEAVSEPISGPIAGPITVVLDACLLAGRILLQSGAETFRVEDTMVRMAKACGVRAESFVMPTGILFSTEDAHWSKLLRISDRSTDLAKVIQVNDVSRRLSRGVIDVHAALAELRRIHQAPESYALWIRLLFAALTSGCFLIMYGGHWPDFLPACIAGGVGYIVNVTVHRFVRLTFFAELMGAFSIGVITHLYALHAGAGGSLNALVVASVMPLVPGILITNAVRDLMTGHLVAGISKGVEASLTAFAIGAGIAVAIQFV